MRSLPAVELLACTLRDAVEGSDRIQQLGPVGDQVVGLLECAFDVCQHLYRVGFAGTD